jgi:23S rRNA pseudouridine1911/1915/1917 synthase
MAPTQQRISARLADRPAAEALLEILRLPRPVVLRLFEDEAVRVDGEVCRDPRRRLRAGELLRWQWKAPPAPKKAAPRHDARLPAVEIVHQDGEIVVVHKPAGLTTVRHKSEIDARSRKYLPPSLVDVLGAMPGLKGGARLRAVHRLDKETSGLVVLARTAGAERKLGEQFRKHTVERSYLALVRGAAKTETIESNFVEDRGDGRRGSSPGPGQRAVTHVELLERLGPFSLVRCRLETGRTHQVRIHLGERGTPLCGERVYDRPLHGRPLPDGSGAARPMLHAATLGIDHPRTGKRMTWSAPQPADMKRLLKQMRTRKGPT